MDTTYILGLAVGVVLGWFALGTIYNLRRGDAMLRWMQGGLPRIGERTSFRWLGSAVAELVIGQAKKPFRRLETLLVLAPRDVVFVWAWALLHGRRDTLILRGQLQVAPAVDLELADPATWTGRMALQHAKALGWEGEPYAGPIAGAGNGLAHDGGAVSAQVGSQAYRLMAPRGSLPLARQTLAGLDAPAARLASRYRRFSVRRETPHLELHLPFPDPRQIDAATFFEALRDLARAVGQGG